MLTDALAITGGPVAIRFSKTPARRSADHEVGTGLRRSPRPLRRRRVPAGRRQDAGGRRGCRRPAGRRGHRGHRVGRAVREAARRRPDRRRRRPPGRRHRRGRLRRRRRRLGPGRRHRRGRLDEGHGPPATVTVSASRAPSSPRAGPTTSSPASASTPTGIAAAAGGHRGWPHRVTVGTAEPVDNYPPVLQSGTWGQYDEGGRAGRKPGPRRPALEPSSTRPRAVSARRRRLASARGSRRRGRAPSPRDVEGDDAVRRHFERPGPSRVPSPLPARSGPRTPSHTSKPADSGSSTSRPTRSPPAASTGGLGRRRPTPQRLPPGGEPSPDVGAARTTPPARRNRCHHRRWARRRHALAQANGARRGSVGDAFRSYGVTGGSRPTHATTRVADSSVKKRSRRRDRHVGDGVHGASEPAVTMPVRRRRGRVAGRRRPLPPRRGVAGPGRGPGRRGPCHGLPSSPRPGQGGGRRHRGDDRRRPACSASVSPSGPTPHARRDAGLGQARTVDLRSLSTAPPGRREGACHGGRGLHRPAMPALRRSPPRSVVVERGRARPRRSGRGDRVLVGRRRSSGARRTGGARARPRTGPPPLTTAARQPGRRISRRPQWVQGRRSWTLGLGRVSTSRRASRQPVLAGTPRPLSGLPRAGASAPHLAPPRG